MKQHPILFNGDMVRAILNGRKTQTRRVMKYQPLHKTPRKYIMNNNVPEKWQDSEDIFEFCPLGQGGHQLWVRETWARWGNSEGASGFDYRADRPTENGRTWKPSIHMPRKASRILLEVTEVKIERVQDISDADAKAEGFKCLTKDGAITYKYGIPEADGWPGPTGWEWNEWEVSPYMAFAKLWDSINKKSGLGWDVNPWVWAVKFEVVK